MASLSTEAHGGRRVQFIDMDGKRRSLRLGTIPLKSAEAILVRVEALIAAKIAGTTADAQTAAWTKEIGDVLHNRLARVGLLKPRKDTRLTLFKMFERYF